MIFKIKNSNTENRNTVEEKKRKYSVLRLRKLFSVFLITVIISPTLFFNKTSAYDSYTYTYEGEFRKSPPAYMPERNVNMSMNLDLPLSKPSDFCITKEGDIFIVDTNNNRIVIFDEKLNLKDIISEFNYMGEDSSFNLPQGISSDDEGNIYVADTENHRIVVFDKNASASRIIGEPQGTGITESFVYKPVSVAVGKDGRIYAVSGTSNMGILSFGEDGLFEGFIGVQPVVFSNADMFWRTFMTRTQREKIRQNIPVDFSYICIDNEGFIFAVSSGINKSSQYNALMSRRTDSTFAPVKRLNPSGDDILKRTGFFPPAGDLDIDLTKSMNLSVSAFNSVAVDDSGIYSVSDATNQRIFTYLPDGYLLGVFGGKGVIPGQFQNISAIKYHDRDLIALDSETGIMTLFSLTEYGSSIYNALNLQKMRQYDKALDAWKNILAMNINQDMIYMQMGRSYLRVGDYDSAMKYLKIVGEKEYYSKAFSEKRNTQMNKILLFAPIIIIIASVLITVGLKKIKTANDYDDLHPPEKIGVLKELQYSFVPLFHPFNGFYNMKKHKRGGMKAGIILMFLATISVLLMKYSSGYLFSMKMEKTSDLLIEALKFLTPFILFILANYGITSLFEGEGTMKDIFNVVAYSLLPLILLLLPGTVIANFLSLDERVFPDIIRIIAYAWCIFMIFIGTLTIHQYTFTKSIIVSFFSIVGIIIIAFLMMLFATLSQKFITFLKYAILELSYRL